jgi:hypothetical protein
MAPPWRKAPAITEAREMKKVLVALMLGMGLAALGAGCGKEEGGGDKGDKADKIGVAECDDYIAKYSACLGKMPAASKPAMEAAFKQMKDAWKTAAAGPGKDGLKTGCKAALDGLAQNPMCK